MRPLALAACAVLAAGAAYLQTLVFPKTEVDYDRSLDFGALGTYAWQAGQEELPNRTNHANVVWHVERSLEKKGLRKAEPAEADVLVRFYVTGESRLRTTTSQTQSWDSTNLRSNVDFDKVQQGAVILELMSRRSGTRAWVGETDFILSEKRRAEDEIRAVVARLFAKYPPKPDARR